MKCPSCNASTIAEPRPDGSEAYVCPECGWGRNHAEVLRPIRRRTILISLRLGLLWAITILLLAGPYLGMRYLFNELEAIAPMDHAVAQLNFYYGWVVVAYLGLCWAFSPEYDGSNLGIFGGGAHSKYNPAWTPEQHYNRLMRTLSLLLMPGKIVLTTLRSTFGLARGRSIPR